jgi:hypothetical protein
VNRVLNDGVDAYTYDVDGHRISRTRKVTLDKEEYAYDHRDRLFQVTFKNSAGTVVKKLLYRYDQLNCMLPSQVDPDGATGSTALNYKIYVHDSNQIALEFASTGSGSATLTDRYLWGPAVV